MKSVNCVKGKNNFVKQLNYFNCTFMILFSQMLE